MGECAYCSRPATTERTAVYELTDEMPQPFTPPERRHVEREVSADGRKVTWRWRVCDEHSDG